MKDSAQVLNGSRISRLDRAIYDTSHIFILVSASGEELKAEKAMQVLNGKERAFQDVFQKCKFFNAEKNRCRGGRPDKT
jgi:hypothetical protein